MAARQITVREPLLKTGCVLGEGPVWDPQAQTLHFVDIDKHKVYHYHPETSDLKIDELDEPIGCLVLRKNRNGFACSAKRGFALLTYDGEGDSKKPKLTYLATPLPSSSEPHVRFNDGACDRRGRFFAGTIHSESPYIGGSLYSLDTDGRCELVDDDGITDSNGLGWSPDDKLLYYTDSFTNRIYVYDYDIETGRASNRRVHIDTSAHGLGSDSFPDGLCIDSEGGIWSARWKGSKVVRFKPDGSIDIEIHFPTAYSVTACCFGGPNLDRLYVTTASPYSGVGRDNSSKTEEARLKQEWFFDSGHLFMVDFAGQFKDGTWRHEYLN